MHPKLEKFFAEREASLQADQARHKAQVLQSLGLVEEEQEREYITRQEKVYLKKDEYCVETVNGQTRYYRLKHRPLRSATRNLPALKPFGRRKKAWRATQRQRRRIRHTAKRTCNSMCPRAPPAYGYASSKYWPGYTGLAASSPQFTPASRSAEPRPCSPTIITSIKTPSTLWRFWRWP